MFQFIKDKLFPNTEPIDYSNLLYKMAMLDPNFMRGLKQQIFVDQVKELGNKLFNDLEKRIKEARDKRNELYPELKDTDNEDFENRMNTIKELLNYYSSRKKHLQRRNKMFRAIKRFFRNEVEVLRFLTDHEGNIIDLEYVDLPRVEANEIIKRNKERKNQQKAQ